MKDSLIKKYISENRFKSYKVLNKDDFNNIHSEIFEIIKYFDEELYQYTKELY
ncbi:hypothetical protein AAX29_00690 [Aliarcobacter thereius]|uniref:Uncharacterized protein n=1 Tax=Aliarcobacter thereius TaxID=544718 RepID=A0A1C0B7Q9_9BACT|nr:hypothetical protein [Aliarcobacter thereius]OCL99645.1 hypothetical protein AAX29_00690 [Aliarcobacter thereius]